MHLPRRSLAVGAAVGAALLLPLPASSSINGPCSASIAGASVKDRSGTDPGDAIRVAKDAQVAVQMSAASAISQLKVQISFAGFHWTVKSGSASGTSWSRTLDVGDYAKWGVGLYQVTGVSSGPGLQCSGTALVRVEGSPLTTPAGGIALGLSILGGLGILGALATALKAHALSAGLFGSLSGLLLGLGVLTLFQQYAVVFPTRGVAIAAVASGIALGALAPSLARALSARR